MDGALADYNAAIKLNSRSSEAYSNRGVVQLDEGDLDRALSDYNVAIRLNPRSPEIHNNRGAARFLKRDLDGAIRDHTEAINLNSSICRSVRRSWRCTAAQGRLGRSHRRLQQGHQVNPYLSDAYFSRGQAWKAKAELSESAMTLPALGKRFELTHVAPTTTPTAAWYGCSKARKLRHNRTSANASA